LVGTPLPPTARLVHVKLLKLPVAPVSPADALIIPDDVMPAQVRVPVSVMPEHEREVHERDPVSVMPEHLRLLKLPVAPVMPPPTERFWV
jgi:hypothetical protein